MRIRLVIAFIGINFCIAAHANKKELSCFVSSYVIDTGAETSERFFGNNGAVKFEFLNQRYSVNIDSNKKVVNYEINEIDGQGLIYGFAPMITEETPFFLKFLDQTKKGLHAIFCRIDLEKL